MTLKTPIAGFLDRNSIPTLSFINAYVVDQPMSKFWDGVHGHPLTHPNPLDAALNPGNYLIKLRTGAATGAPNAMKTIGGFNPVTVVDPADQKSGTVGPYWTSAYLARSAEFWNLMATAYDADPNLREITVSDVSLVYDEPFRLYSQSLFGPTWSLGVEEAAFATMYSAHTVFKKTLQDLAFNPFTGDPAFTEQQITAVRAAFSNPNQVVIGNNSLGPTSQGTPYDAMYAAIQTAGGPIYFQTATLSRIGKPYSTNFNQTMLNAQQYGAGSVELPVYATLSADLLEQWQDTLGG